LKIAVTGALASAVAACDRLGYMACAFGDIGSDMASDIGDALSGKNVTIPDPCVKSQKMADCMSNAGCYSECEAALASPDGFAKDCPTQKCGAACFPATATVELSNGKIKSMDQVKIGDKVRVGPGEFSEVYFFSTEMAETNAKFTKIATDGVELVLTSGHYLYVNGELATAGSVKPGDVIVLGDNTKAAVNEVTTAWAPGLYNPHTLHGDIIVNGVKTSTYTDAVHPKLAHALLSPLRTMYSAGASFGQGFSSATKSLPAFLLKAIKG